MYLYLSSGEIVAAEAFSFGGGEGPGECVNWDGSKRERGGGEPDR